MGLLQVMYQQLLSEPKSRINACPNWDVMAERWTDNMTLQGLNVTHFRKSWQWFALNRDVAQVGVGRGRPVLIVGTWASARPDLNS